MYSDKENYKNAPSLIARSIFILTASFFIFLSETLEKFTHGGGAFFTENTACNIYLMIKFRFVKYIQYRTGTSGFNIGSTEYYSRYPSLYNCSGTHGTWFYCYIQRTFFKTPISHKACRFVYWRKFAWQRGFFLLFLRL